MQRNSSPGRPRASAAHAKSRVGSNVKLVASIATVAALAGGSLIAAGAAHADSYESRFTYTANSGGQSYTITKYDSAEKDRHNDFQSDTGRLTPSFPGTYNSKPVTAIGSSAADDIDLTSVTIAASITSIGASAFKDNNITSVTVVSGLLTIGDHAFEDNSLSTISIPSTVTSIGNSAFEDNNLTTVTVPAAVTVIDDEAFYDNAITTVTLNEGLTSLNNSAFKDNKLTSVTIPSTVTSFGSDVFGDNDGKLASVTFLGNAPTTFTAATRNAGSLTQNDDDSYDDLYVTFNSAKTGFTVEGTAPNFTWKGYKVITGGTLQTATLPDATYEEVYTDFQLEGSGITKAGSTDVTYTITGLPTGMSASTDGLISGTPELALPGTYTITIVTSNGVAPDETTTRVLTVNPRLLKFSNTDLPAGQEGVSYSAEFTITGDETIVLNDDNDNLAGLGLSLDREGNTVSIEGTPDRDTAGTDLHFTITASNNLTGDVDHEFTITIAAAVPLTFAPITLPEGQAGQAYPSQQFAAATGTAPVTFSSTTDLEALGLALSEDGELTGTPTTAGETSIEVTISNGYADDATETFTFTVIPVTIAELALNFVAGSNADDATVSFEAEGLEEDSAYTLTLHSDPFILSQGFVTHNGILTITASIPANTPAGAHSVVLSAIGYDGKPVTRTAWFSILADGTIGGISYTEEVGYELLSTTGTNPAVPLGAAILMLLAGGLLVLRRRTSTI